MKQNWQKVQWVLMGLALAASLTIFLMALMTIAVWKWNVQDSTIMLLNQLMKMGCVAFGTIAAVRSSGESGFLIGAMVGCLYMAVGYGVYAALGGVVDAQSIAGEFLIGCAAGALTGAIAVNIPGGHKASRA